jgi:small subunit ribosomal protein S3
LGQKVHPYGLRLGYNKTWKSRWYAKKDYAALLHEDLRLRKELKKQLGHAGVSNIEIERPGNKIRRKGSEIDKLKADLQKRTNREIFININEIHRPEVEAQLVAESIAMQLEKRIAFRRAMRKAVDTALKVNAKGIKVYCAGRLNGAEIARTEWYLQGQLPLHTLRADIDYGFAEARTTYGAIGVKVWIYKGEVFPALKAKQDSKVVKA